MTPTQHLARIRRCDARVRVVTNMRLAAQGRFAEAVEEARRDGVPWAQICEAAGGQAETSVRQKLAEAARRAEKGGVR